MEQSFGIVADLVDVTVRDIARFRNREERRLAGLGALDVVDSARRSVSAASSSWQQP